MRNFWLYALAFLLFFPAAPARAEMLAGAYEAEVIEVVDGDTVRARVHVWLGQDVTALVRLSGIDTPELSAGCAAERAAAQQAKERLSALAQPGAMLVLSEIKADKYGGRIVARTALPGQGDLAAILTREHLARPYDGGTKAGWC